MRLNGRQFDDLGERISPEIGQTSKFSNRLLYIVFGIAVNHIRN